MQSEGARFFFFFFLPRQRNSPKSLLGEKEEEEEPESLEASVQWRACGPGQAGKWERRPKLLAALISRSPGLLYVVVPLSYTRRMDIKYRSLLYSFLSPPMGHTRHAHASRACAAPAAGVHT